MAWLILSESPPVASIIGAAIVLATVLAHACSDLNSKRVVVPHDVTGQ